MVLFDKPEGVVAAAELLGQVSNLVLEYVGEALEEDERQDVVLELRRVYWASDGAGRFSQPAFKGGDVQGVIAFSHRTPPLRIMVP